ncbi:MAG: polyprenyl synthetase family protein [Gemmataceae bacterium]
MLNMSATTLPIPVPVPLADFPSPLTADLEEVEQILSRSLRNKNPHVAEVVDHVRGYRGKRLRPTLLFLVARACGKVVPAHYTLAAVVEMIHTATLVHDDVLDGAKVRRRLPTVHALWGIQTSVLLGDYLFTHAFHLASTVDSRACEIISAATDRVCEGELFQVMRAGAIDLSEAEYFEMIDGKTAALTACCCELGALYSGMAPEMTERLSQFGRLVGQAFQITDDLLDLVGDEKVVGKSLGTDLKQRKMTLPIIHLLRCANSTEKEKIRLAINTPSDESLNFLRKRLDDAGSLDYSRQTVIRLLSQARSVLANLPVSIHRTSLESITDQILERNQ